MEIEYLIEYVSLRKLILIPNLLKLEIETKCYWFYLKYLF